MFPERENQVIVKCSEGKQFRNIRAFNNCLIQKEKGGNIVKRGLKSFVVSVLCLMLFAS